MIKSIEIDNIKKNKIKYSICTLVTDFDQYSTMLDSFEKSGFTNDNSEFIYIDNLNNKYNAYNGINKFISNAIGMYIIICHQDIEIKFDNKEKLDFLLKELYNKDLNWAIAGNVGGVSLGRLAVRMSDPHGNDIKIGNFPQSVSSLDENFLVLNKDVNISLSFDLEGFHLYGTDICLLARIRGLKSYVIDFHLLHKSPGNVNKNFFKARKDFINKYQLAFKYRIIQTTCTNMFLSSSKFLNLIINQSVLNKIKRIFISKKKNK